MTLHGERSLAVALGHTFGTFSNGALFVDFDGTLSEVVPIPDEARAVPGAVEAMAELSRRLGRVAVVSGRPLAFLQAQFPETVDIVGLYGVERRIGGVVTVDSEALGWRVAVGGVVAAAYAGPPGMRVEDKGLSLTLHYRERPEIEDEVRAWAADQAERSGLLRRDARKSQELHPPTGVDKGTALLDLVGDAGGVAYLGDDIGDAPAFDALDRLEVEGRSVLRVVAKGPGSPTEILERADWLADGPVEIAQALAELAATDVLPGS